MKSIGIFGDHEAGCLQRWWKEAAEAARRYGLNPTAQALRLDYHGLKKRMAAAPAPTEQRKQVHAPPAFVELMAPTGEATTDCHVEVESNAVPSYHETLARMPSAA